jgi:hypothetical protein
VNGFSLRYAVLSSGPGQLWLPPALCALFAVVSMLLRDPARQATLARIYLGFVVPLATGVLAAYATLDDDALELRFSTPVPPWRLLAEPLGLTLAVAALCAGLYSVLVRAMGIWVVPSLALMAVGSTAALIGRQPSTGALAAGLVWLVELIARSSMLRSAVGSHLLIFLGAIEPDHPALRANQCTLLALSAALFLGAALLLRRQERYL